MLRYVGVSANEGLFLGVPILRMTVYGSVFWGPLLKPPLAQSLARCLIVFLGESRVRLHGSEAISGEGLQIFGVPPNVVVSLSLSPPLSLYV